MTAPGRRRQQGRGGAGAIAAALAARSPGSAPPLAWRLHWQPVCASTERQLDRRLAAGQSPPLAVIARRQTRGHGQQGRLWQSPPGGLWLSAALPWSVRGQAAPALAVAVGLALQLESLGLQPRIKWPNDLLLGGRKLAGVLPRLRWRGGELLGCRVGVGLNGLNRVPPGAIALAEALDRGGSSRIHHPQAAPERLAALVLRALEWAVAASDQAELVRRQAERRLWSQGPLLHDGLPWQLDGLANDGGLRLSRGEDRLVLRRDVCSGRFPG